MLSAQVQTKTMLAAVAVVVASMLEVLAVET
jgi:hypothetical protein